jgi:dTDP-4-dehydrorhamnose 3,5-epimerase
MIYKKQKIADVMLIDSQCHKDERGLFRRHYCNKELLENGIEFTAKQGNISENKFKYTLRGFHYQKPPSRESKIISCIRGSVFNVIIDLRNESPTFLSCQSFYLSSENRESLFIPVGCANAFLTLEDSTWIHYYMNDHFINESLGFRYDDPSFNIEWPASPLFLSKKDKNYPVLDINSL